MALPIDANYVSGTDSSWAQEEWSYVTRSSTADRTGGTSPKEYCSTGANRQSVQNRRTSTKSRCRELLEELSRRVVQRLKKVVGDLMSPHSCLGEKCEEASEGICESDIGSLAVVGSENGNELRRPGCKIVYAMPKGGGAGAGKGPLPLRYSDHLCHNPRDLALGEVIGRGAQGCVRKADLNGATVAVKIVRKEQSAPRTIEGVFETPELSLLYGVSHPNLVQIYGVFEAGAANDERPPGMPSASEEYAFSDIFSTGPCHMEKEMDVFSNVSSGQIWVVMEFCDCGSLWDAVKRGEFNMRGMPDVTLYSKIMQVALEIAYAIQYLHELHIIHGDLKAQNVFLVGSPRNPKVKVGDFGLCRRPKLHRRTITTFSWGTVDHMAPETLRDGQLHFATDVFSFAMVLLEMMTGRHPYRRMPAPAVVVAIVEGVRPNIPSSCPVPLVKLIRACWHQDWRNRPTFKDIVHQLMAMMF